jgi:maleylacetoacetate isomerase
MKLYTYYRSQASFRVRIALNLKGIAREDSFLHLEKGDQFAAAYRAINPQMVVPTLIDGDVKLFQSLAILEYLEEMYPEPPLLPSDPQARAWVRGLALINAADSHPLIVPRVRHYLTDVLKVSDEQRLVWNAASISLTSSTMSATRLSSALVTREPCRGGWRHCLQ